MYKHGMGYFKRWEQITFRAWIRVKAIPHVLLNDRLKTSDKEFQVIISKIRNVDSAPVRKISLP